ncbi:hypothetical protein D3C72_1579500 [compost metagenome]
MPRQGLAGYVVVAAVAERVGRQVDRQRERNAPFQPLAALRQRLVQALCVEFEQVVVAEMRQEAVRRQQRVAVPQSRQCLYLGDRAGVQVEDGLVVHFKAAAAQQCRHGYARVGACARHCMKPCGTGGGRRGRMASFRVWLEWHMSDRLSAGAACTGVRRSLGAVAARVDSLRGAMGLAWRGGKDCAAGKPGANR